MVDVPQGGGGRGSRPDLYAGRTFHRPHGERQRRDADEEAVLD